MDGGNPMWFGVPALLTVGASWSLVGVVLGRAPRDGLDTGFVQLCGGIGSLAFGSLLLWILAPSAPGGLAVVLPTCAVYLCAGAVNFCGLQAMSAGMKRGPHGIVWSIMQSALVFPFLVGVIGFGEKFTLPRGTGLVLLLAALALFGMARDNGGPAGAKSGGEWRRWAFLALGLMAIQQTLGTLPSYFAAAREVSSVARTLSAGTGTVLAAIVTLGWRRSRGGAAPVNAAAQLRNPRLWLYAGTLQFFGLLFAYTLLYPGLDAMARAGAGAVSYPMLVGSCMVAFLLYARWGLGERLTKFQFAGLTLALAGLAGFCFPAR